MRRARAGLISFACYVDRPVAKWYRAKHLTKIAAHLEKLGAGGRLAISVAPRHWKSSLTSEKFAAWYLGKNPNHSVIVASHSATLAEKFSRTVRDLVESSPRYHKLFPDAKIRKDSNRGDDWLLETGVRSSFRAVGVGSGIAGFGANLIIIDDLFGTYEQAASATYRENAWQWYRGILRGRLEPGGSIVIVNSRWHEDDTIGRLQKAEKEEGGEHFEIVNLPVWDGQRYLWQERFSVQEYEALKSAVGDTIWRTQYEGQPVPLSGNLIKRDWFEYVPKLPDGSTWQVRAWDVAWTEKQTQKDDPDYIASVAACQVGDVTYLGLPRLFRTSLEKVATEIISSKMQELRVRYGMGQSAIKASIVTALNNAGFSIEGYAEHTDKIARASGWINRASTGQVKLVGTDKDWEPFTAQWFAFPHGAHDDAIDAVSGVMMMLGLVFQQKYREPDTGYSWSGALRG